MNRRNFLKVFTALSSGLIVPEEISAFLAPRRSIFVVDGFHKMQRSVVFFRFKKMIRPRSDEGIFYRHNLETIEYKDLPESLKVALTADKQLLDRKWKTEVYIEDPTTGYLKEYLIK